MASDELPISSNSNRGLDNFNPNNNLASADDEIDLNELIKSALRKKRIMIITASFVFLFSFINTAKNRILNPIYSGSFTILISDPLDAQKNQSLPSGNISSVFKNIASNSTMNDIPTLIRLLKSPYLIEDLSKEFKLSPNSLSNMINIEQGSYKGNLADVLDITINSSSFEQGKSLLNRLSEVYLQAAIEQKRRRLKDGLDFLNKQAPSMLEKNNNLQSRLADFRIKNSLIVPTLNGTSIKTTQRNLDEGLRNINARKNRLEYIKKQIEEGFLSARGFQETVTNGDSGGLRINDFDQAILQELLEVEEQLAKARTKYTEDSVIVKAFKLKLRRIQPVFLENQLKAVDTAIRLNEGMLITAKKQRLELEEIFSDQPTLIKEYNNIEQELELSKQNLVGLVKARESFQLEMAQETIPWRIISPPIMRPSPIKPSIPKNLALGAILGILSGVLAALIRDRLDYVFHNPVEVKEKLSVPILGHIPYVNFAYRSREKKESIVDMINKVDNFTEDKNVVRQNFIWQEAMRNISTSIRFLNTENSIRSIAITSSIPAEGKSAGIIMLAKVLTDLGFRVLVIDADLRKPQMHLRLGLNNIKGFSNILTDVNTNFRDFIQQVGENKNWFAITAGQKVPDPTRLFGSKRMTAFAKEISDSNQFDYILYDTTPAIGLADPALIARNLDGYILVVSMNNVDRNLPSSALNRINAIGGSNLGIITCTNNEGSSNKSENSTEYAEYGGYGYYYSDDDDDDGDNFSEQKTFLSKLGIDENKLRTKVMPLINKIKEIIQWLDN